MSTKISVVGLGPGHAEYLSLGALDALRRASKVLVRTRRHPTVEQLGALGVEFADLDWVYESCETPEEVYGRLAEEVIKQAAATEGELVYAVPGHPLVAEASVQKLLAEAEATKIEIAVVPSISAVELCLLRVGVDLLEGLQIVDAQAEFRAQTETASLFLQLDSRRVASEVKLSLLEVLPPEHEVILLQAIGSPERERVERRPLVELDRREDFDHLTSLFVPAAEGMKRPAEFKELVELIAKLRSDEGCPWDREQDHRSMRPCLEEETQEVLEAIEKEDPQALCEELGDLLLQVLFHAQLATEAGEFNINDVLRGLKKKLIERHPHVFGGEKIETAAEVLEVWEALKRKARSE